MPKKTAPPPRRKSCNACYAAKRTCDQQSPCTRCSKRDVECVYPSRVVKAFAASSPARSSTIGQQDQPEPHSIEQDANAASMLTPTTNKASTMFVHIYDGITLSTFNTTTRPNEENAMISSSLLNIATTAHSNCPPDKAYWVASMLKLCPMQFLTTSRTDFIHDRLYDDAKVPAALLEAYSLCAIYCSSSGPASSSFSRAAFDSAADRLMSVISASSRQHDVETCLANVQALIILSMIRLFSSDARQRNLAESTSSLLDELTLVLQNSTCLPLPTHWTAWRRWILRESIQRTVFVSYILRGTFALIRYGYCHVIGPISTAVLCPRPVLWDSADENEWHRAVEEGGAEEVTYEDWCALYKMGRRRNEWGNLERLMLGACEGGEAVKVLMP